MVPRRLQVLLTYIFMDAKSHLKMISNTKENVKSRNNEQKKIVKQCHDDGVL